MIIIKCKQSQYQIFHFNYKKMTLYVYGAFKILTMNTYTYGLTYILSLKLELLYSIFKEV